MIAGRRETRRGRFFGYIQKPYRKGAIMKKTKSPKLTLSRETLKGLDADGLQAPRGGASAGPTNCLTCGQVCVDQTIVTRYNC
jgi:hypothetical protein